MNITILGVPFNGDGTSPEAENPAKSIREAGLGSQLATRGYHVSDLGDLRIPEFEGVRDPKTGVLNQEAWRKITRDLAARLHGRLDGSQLLLLLGGDCSIMTGVCSALQAVEPPTGLIYLDGHADYRWPLDSPTGEPADLVLTALTGRIPGLFADVTPSSPLSAETDIAVFGFRDRDRIDESTITTYDRDRIRKDGVARIVGDGLSTLGERFKSLWLHFDVDVLDPGIMTCVLFPEQGGLTKEETREFIAGVLSSGRVLGISIACYHPRLDPDLSGARCIVEIIVDALTMSVVL